MKQFCYALILGSLLVTACFADTGCFILTQNEEILTQEGDCDTRRSCCSTFKIVISLMGYNEGILKDELQPQVPYQEGYYALLDSWKQPHDPSLWMKNSCVWYSQWITKQIGMPKFEDYVKKFDYGNGDVSGDEGKGNGLTNSWLSSSLKISPKEQTIFIKKLIDGKLPVSSTAHEMTKRILFVSNIDCSWRLFGKTGSGYLLKPDGSRDENRQIGWFVGWVQRGNNHVVFAHFIQDDKKHDEFAGKRAKDSAIEKITNFVDTCLKK